MATTAADAPLLATKLFVPPPRPNRVDRARLRDQLDGARGGTITLAAAAAGSGKSTLLADWALSAQKRVAWLSLDAADDAPSRFLSYVIAALKHAGAIAPLTAFVEASLANPAAIDAILMELLNAIAERHADTALILDDYHVIESENVHRIVQEIIDHIPANLHLVIASRVDPPLALSRLRARGMLLELRAADLRFTPDEASRFFNDSMSLGLTEEQVGELEQRTEGWAVGLQLAAISLRGRGANNFISSFSGSNRYVLDYLTDEVLLRQPEDVRTFLLETSILTQLSAPLCDAVTGRNDSERILRLLDAGNLFLIGLDDVRFWYRYHHLFGSLLQHELERSSSGEQIAALHRRASAWYLTSGMPEPALRHAVAGRDDDQALAIVSEHARKHIMAGDGGTVARWISQLPRDRVENDVQLLLLHARALTNLYDLVGARDEVNRAEQILPAEAREQYAGTILSLRGILEGLTGNLARSIDMLEHAMPLFDKDDFWFSMTSLHLGVTALMVPDLRKGELYLDRATEYRDRPDGLLTAVVGRCYGGSSALWRGQPDLAMQMAREANGWIEAWDARHETGRPLASLSHMVFADVERMWNNLDRARVFAQQAIEFGKAGFLIGYFEACRALAQIAESQGDWEAAMSAAQEMSRGCRFSGNSHLLGPTQALEYHVVWRRGLVTASRDDLNAVQRWCDQSGLLDVAHWRERMHPGLYTDAALMIGARVLLHQERYHEARQLTDALLEEAVRSERVPAQITLLILRSLIEAAVGSLDAAVETMRRSLDLASNPRFVRPFLDEGSALLPIIERAAPRVADRDFALRVLSAFEVPVKRQAAPAGVSEALSERELEVLQLIASGASNQAAARKLFVATSTVKKHLENIYAKLGVGGRTQAVARARELHIL